MSRYRTTLGVSLLLLILAGPSLRAAGREMATVESATESLRALSAIPLKGIPPCLLQEARGVAIIPNVVKAGFVLGGRFGRGVVLVRQPDGSWGNPVFITLAGAGVGWQIGVQATDVVLVFATSNGLDRILQGKGKLTLGGDVAVAAGPVGRQAEAATDGMLRAEIYSYSRSRGLFAGVSLEGAGLLVDCESNAAFYNLPGGRPADVQTFRGPIPAAVAALQTQLSLMSGPPPVIVAPPMPAPPAPPLPLPTPPPPGR
jgi:lipid-binding SYLF domain-containing protein